MSPVWYCINDLDEFVDGARKLVFKFFGNTNDLADDSLSDNISNLSKEEIEELDTTLTHDESMLIVKSLAKKKTLKKAKTTRYYITDKILASIIEELNARMISNILTRLTSRGILESAYDSEIDDFVFWVKDEDQGNKPETD